MAVEARRARSSAITRSACSYRRPDSVETNEIAPRIRPRASNGTHIHDEMPSGFSISSSRSAS